MNNKQSSSNRSVNRRRFVKAAGAAGTVALAGCSGNGDGGDGGGGDDGTDDNDRGGNDGGDTTGTPGQETITLDWAADPRIEQNKDVVLSELRNAGLPEHIELNIIAGSSVTDQRQDQYTQWLNSQRSKPDLLMMDGGWTIPFIVRDQVENLENHLSSDHIDTVNEEYFDSAVSTSKSQDGKLHAIPMWVGLPGMGYRKDLVKEAGYDPDGENWATEGITWEKFSKVVSEVKESNDGIEYGYTFQAADYEGLSCCNFNEFLSSWGGAYFGGNLFGPIGDRPITVNEEPVLNSIRMIRTFIHGEDDSEALDGYAGNIAPEAVLQWNEQNSADPFLNGNAVANRNWPSYIKDASEELGDSLGFMPIPHAVSADEAKYDGRGGPVGALGGWNMTMNPYSEKKEAATEFIKATMADSFHLEAVFKGVGQIPPKPSVLSSEGASEVPEIGRFMDTFRVIGENAVPRPVTAVWPQQSSEISGEVNTTLGQSKSPEDAMSDLESSLKQIEESV
ncbi:substrate-binding domain-containing protein [Halomicrobium urmianum]|uniref:substrate-binding domain-containing protein n=1 Tax=Halomicrobium urmianum TaxID=1586233 RepID=UPI001CD945D1|nr:substrate-binding domain-containing protein [Halomicrobium urmianum]